MSYTKDSLPVTRDPRSSCLSVTQNATRNKECLLGSVGIRYPACAWGLILIFYSPKKVCSSLTTGTQWIRGLAFYRTHTLEESTHTAARTLVPFLQMKLALQREHVIPFSQSVDILHFWPWKNLGMVVNVDV